MSGVHGVRSIKYKVQDTLLAVVQGGEERSDSIVLPVKKARYAFFKVARI